MKGTPGAVTFAGDSLDESGLFGSVLHDLTDLPARMATARITAAAAIDAFRDFGGGAVITNTGAAGASTGGASPGHVTGAMNR